MSNIEQEVGGAVDHGEQHGHPVVTVINEDDGMTHPIPARRGEEVGDIIERMYRDFLRVERQADDRLRCDGNGEDVFQFASLRLAQYLHQGHCTELRWVFTGGTGGA